MELRQLPREAEMYGAVVSRDSRYDGVFFTAVRTTRIFCRPSCHAKTPARKNVEFYGSAQEAILHGYRACLKCRPLEPPGSAPEWLQPLMEEIQSQPDRRWTAADLRAREIDPARVRRWFKAHHGMTFQAYHRAVRIGRAMWHIRSGAPVTSAAYDAGYESLSGFYQAFQHIIGEAPKRSDAARSVYLHRIATPLGSMLAAATETSLCLLEFTDRRMLETQLRRVASLLSCSFLPVPNDVLLETERQLNSYFAGTLTQFTIPLELVGSEFQQAAWTQLLQIPPGETRSYAEQARHIGRPSAVRAVARANGDNRIAIIIPCHRVVGSDGRLTGYGGGLWRKKFLLEHEQRYAAPFSMTMEPATGNPR